MYDWPTPDWRHWIYRRVTREAQMAKEKITTNDVIAAHDALKKNLPLSKMGIAPCVWKLYGECSRHGKISAQVTTWGDPPDVMSVTCLPCDREGTKRTVSVKDLEKLTGKVLPEF